MKLYVVIRDFLIDFDWGSEVIGIYDNLNKAQNICNEENLKTQKDYEKEYNIPHNKNWSSEDYYKNCVKYAKLMYYIIEEIS